MWEQIQSNRRRSLALIFTMAGVLALLGFVLGEFVAQGHGLFGVGAAFALWAILLATAFGGGDAMLLSAAGAREIEKADMPQLFNVVEEMKIASGLDVMPKIYVIDDPVPNAFAVGRRKDHCAVAVTSGLLSRLNRDELQGVIAHEIAHIRNRDVLFMTLAGVMLGAIVMLADVVLRSMWYGSYRRRSRSSGGGQAQAVLMIVALVLAILAPFLAQILYFACSRRREYLADAGGAQFTRYPEGLASALEKIAGEQRGGKEVNRALAPMYIVSPRAAHSAAVGLFSTHPPVQERIRILRSMAGAAFGDYQKAYQQVRGTRTKLLKHPTGQPESIPLRGPSAEAAPLVPRRHTADVLHRLDNYFFITCACGVRLKVPEGYRGDTVQCPRCHRRLPLAQAAAALAAVSAGVQAEEAEDRAPSTPDRPAPSQAPLRYTRRGSGWESFKCACGHTLQLSPAFSGSTITCRKCGRTIEVD